MNNNRTKLKSQLFYTGLFLYCVPTILQTTLLVETSYWNELFVYLRYIAFYFGIVLIADEHMENGSIRILQISEEVSGVS